MQFFNKTAEFDALQYAIDTLYSDLQAHKPYTEDYDKITDQIVKLKKLQNETTHSWKPSPDALVGAAGSVLGIVLILQFEKIGVITSKAVGFVRQLKN
jgi:hypothetical protein